MNEDEIKKRIEDVERRISLLEERKQEKNKEDITSEENYSGLAGGVRFLIKGGFFNEPRLISDIINELKREGYHYSDTGVASTLSETFTKKQKILNRTKDGKNWRYVIRK